MIRLYDYFLSSACYRVRIALNLKGLAYERNVVNLLGDEQRNPSYLDANPAGLVPLLEIDGRSISQSLAIIDYLDSAYPEPRLLPGDAGDRALILGLSLDIACDIHPLNNLRVLRHLRRDLGADKDQVTSWYVHWVKLGLDALEERIAPLSRRPFLLGERPGLFELCLVPQLYNARRYHMDLSAYPALSALDEAARALPEFREAAPERFAPAGAG